MNPLRCLVVVLVTLTILVAHVAPVLTDAQQPDAQKGDDGFVPMFNGKDLTGWVNVNCAPSTFFVKDNQIITTGKPTGYLRTEKQYENFIAEFDWMHVPPTPDAVGNSGFFVWADPIPAVGTGYTRGIEVQVLVNLEKKDHYTSQGDLFSIWGAKCVPDRPHPQGWERCLPSENRCKGANEWNHYRVEANDGVLKLAVNGKVVSGVSKCNPRKGYLALESEGSECRFKNLKIKELPSTNPKPEEICDVAKGHQVLYTGLNLSGWKVDDAAKAHWKAKDTVLHYDGKGEAKNNGLRTEKMYGDAEYIVDFRFPKEGANSCTFEFRSTDKTGLKFTFYRNGNESIERWAEVGGSKIDTTIPPGGKPFIKPAGQWNRLRLDVQATNMGSNTGITYTINGSNADLGKGWGPLPKTGVFAMHADGAIDFANLFVRELGQKEK